MKMCSPSPSLGWRAKRGQKRGEREWQRERRRYRYGEGEGKGKRGDGYMYAKMKKEKECVYTYMYGERDFRRTLVVYNMEHWPPALAGSQYIILSRPHPINIPFSYHSSDPIHLIYHSLTIV
jgi:hypothetical protein